MSRSELLEQYRPKVGDPITYRGKVVGTVTRTEQQLCWWRRTIDRDDGGMFIWCFRDGLNAMHSWPGKDEARNAPCPGV